MNADQYLSSLPNSGKCPEVALLPCSTGMHLSRGEQLLLWGCPRVMSMQEARRV